MTNLKEQGTAGIIIKAFFSLMIAIFMSGAAMAQVPTEQGTIQEQVQTDFSDEELEQFVDVYIQANEIRMENESSMMQAIEEENIDMEKFNEILMARQQQQPMSEINATAEEMAAFNKAAQKIMKVQQEAQKEINQLIEEEIGAQTYQQIGMAYQQDPELQEEINQLLEEKVSRK